MKCHSLGVACCLLASAASMARAQPRYDEDTDCLTPEVPPWCVKRFSCTDDTTQEHTALARIRLLPDHAPVDTAVVPVVRNICHVHGLELPSVHTDLQNWCLLQAGLYGTKGRIPLGMEVNASHPKGWAWMDGTPV